jgi:hypothetical protein
VKLGLNEFIEIGKLIVFHQKILTVDFAEWSLDGSGNAIAQAEKIYDDSRDTCSK